MTQVAVPSGRPTKRVLIVDDSRVSRTAVAERLAEMGCETTLASSGEEAFEACLNGDFDLVVSDLEMEGLSGVQLCRILRSVPETADTPFLLLTSHDDPRSRFWSRHAGADDHLCKADMRAELGRRVVPLLAKERVKRDPRRRVRTKDARARLNDVLERSLFDAVITAEARRLFELTGDGVALAGAVLELVSQLTRSLACSLTLPPGGPVPCATRIPTGLTSEHEARWLRALDHDAEGLLLREDFVRRGPNPAESVQASVFPLEVAGERLGSLKLLTNTKGLLSEDEATARRLAESTAPALRQLRLLQEMQCLATTDELTDVANRRESQRRLDQEVARATRYGTPLCAALIDVDHFKNVNDKFGHSAGDAVLREVAAALQTGIRQVDVAGRWGGEEFLLVLPDTPIAGATLLAERLRRRVRLATTAAELPCHVTVSIGVAEYEPGLSSEAFVDRADQALYRAKDSGRDRVVCWREPSGVLRVPGG